MHAAGASAQFSGSLRPTHQQFAHHGRLATIVSNSWGGIPHSTYGDEDPATMAAYSALFQRGGAQGISFLFASGDCGAKRQGQSRRTAVAQGDTRYAVASSEVSNEESRAIGA